MSTPPPGQPVDPPPGSPGYTPAYPPLGYGTPPGPGGPPSGNGGPLAGSGPAAPGYGTPPGYGPAAPGCGGAAPGYGGAAPGYGAPPGYGGAAPGYGGPPGYGGAAPGYGGAAPGYGGGAPGYGGGAPGYGGAAPGYGAPPGYGGAAPSYGPPAGYGPSPTYGPSPRYGPLPSYGPPPGYGAPPSYGTPTGYGRPPGYGPPPGSQYGPPPLVPGAVKPGIIPLRPLTLSDIFNGAVGYVRANPKAALGLTAIVVVVMQIITLAVTLAPLTAYGRIGTDRPEEVTLGAIGASMASLAASVLITWLGGMLLSGMLTVVVGRAVFGSPITIGETWVKIRGRILALLGLALLEAAVAAALFGLVILIIVVLAATGNAAVVVLLGIPLVLGVIALGVYLYTVVLFAPVLIVLERLPVIEAITRSFALVRNSFWRVFGIRALTFLVASVVAGAVGAPFSVAGQLLMGSGMVSTGVLILGTTLSSIGSAVGQIITAPFSAGAVVLLYTDRRMRAEAFDLVLQTGAAGGPSATESTDNLWLTRPI